MAYIDELDSLLKKIKKEHFDTVHKLSELYRKAEKLISEIKEQGEENIEQGMEKLKSIIAESANVKDTQVNDMSEYFKTLFKTVINKFNNAENQNKTDNSVENSFFNFPEPGTLEGFFGMKLEKEDTDKLFKIAQNSMGAMYGLFKRFGEIIGEDAGKKK